MPELKPNQVLIGGKIVETRFVNKTHYTQIVLPAPDEYSNPQRIEIASSQRLGQKGDQIIQACDIGGYLGKEFFVTDQQTGEKISRRAVIMSLRAIDA